jgi:hypothetical protein
MVTQIQDYQNERNKTQAYVDNSMLDFLAKFKPQDPSEIDKMLKLQRLQNGQDPYSPQSQQMVPQGFQGQGAQTPPPNILKALTLGIFGGNSSPQNTMANPNYMAPNAGIQNVVPQGQNTAQFINPQTVPLVQQWQKQFGSDDDKRNWAALAKYDPQTAQSILSMANYDEDPTKVESMRTNRRGNAIRAIQEFDPNWNQNEYGRINAYQRSLGAGGQEHGKIISMNTLAQHLDGFNESLKDLPPDSAPPVNFIVNEARRITGDPTMVDSEIARNITKDELLSLLHQGVSYPTDVQLGLIDKVVDRDSPVKVKQQAVKSFMHIVEGRMKPLEEDYRQQLKRDPKGLIVHPETREIFKKLRGETGSSSTKGLPSGVTENDIQFTMKKNKLTREQVLARLK